MSGLQAYTPARREPAGDYTAEAGVPFRGEAAAVAPTAVLSAVLRRWWWAVLMITVISAIGALVVATQVDSDSAIVRGTLMFNGLPASSARVYDELDANTAAEMLTSTSLLTHWARARGLEESPTLLARRIVVENPRRSRLLEVNLKWNDAAEGVDMVNELMERFIASMVQHRRGTLDQHIKHVESSLLTAKADVERTRRRLNDLHAKQQEYLESSGLNQSQQQAARGRVDATQRRLDQRSMEKLALDEQIRLQRARLIEKQGQLATLAKREQVAISQALAAELKQMRPYASRSAEAERINRVLRRVSGVARAPGAGLDRGAAPREAGLDRLLDTLAPSSSGLSLEESQFAQSVVRRESAKFAAEYKAFERSVERAASEVSQMELGLIPIATDIKLLETQLEEIKAASSSTASALPSGWLLDESELVQELQEAEDRRSELTQRLSDMLHLRWYPMNEWVVSTPASFSTTVAKSSKRQYFAVSFLAIGLAFVLPLCYVEYARLRPSSIARFAEERGIPLAGERLLEGLATGDTSPEAFESLRSLALRVQQSMRKKGGVVLFASADGRESATPLLAAVAHCLAARDEQVLVVDANCPIRSPQPVSNLLRSGEAPEEEAPTADGLAEYLDEECEDLSEVVRSTAVPGIDFISSGRSEFGREAMASACLTSLLQEASDRYSFVLVSGPPVTAVADFQMLTARADGVVLAAGEQLERDSAASAAIEELVDLGAPMIGIVG